MTAAITPIRRDLKFWVSTTAAGAGLVSFFAACMYIVGVGKDAAIAPESIPTAPLARSAITQQYLPPEPLPAYAEFVGFLVGDKIMSCTELMNSAEAWSGLDMDDQVMIARMCEE